MYLSLFNSGKLIVIRALDFIKSPLHKIVKVVLSKLNKDVIREQKDIKK